MSTFTLEHIIEITAGIALCCAFLALWLRSLPRIIMVLAVQGAAVALLAALVGIHGEESAIETLFAAWVVFTLKCVILPMALLGLNARRGFAIENSPVLNFPTSLLTGAALTMIAHYAMRDIVNLEPTQSMKAAPLGIAMMLIGLLMLATRRNALSQITGFLLVDNGISVVAILATGGWPLIVELGASFDILLVVLILSFLATRIHQQLGTQQVDQLRELRD